MSPTTQQPVVLWIGIDPYRFAGYRNEEHLMRVVQHAANRFPPGTMELWLFGPDDDLTLDLARRLREHPWQCVMIGQGVRAGPVATQTLEHIVNLIRRNAPDAAIAFNETIHDGLEAASRWVAGLRPRSS